MMDKEIEVIVNFYRKFVEYVKEMDSDLWSRARDYAITYHDTDEAEIIDTQHEGDSEFDHPEHDHDG